MMPSEKLRSPLSVCKDVFCVNPEDKRRLSLSKPWIPGGEALVTVHFLKVMISLPKLDYISHNFHIFIAENHEQV